MWRSGTAEQVNEMDEDEREHREWLESELRGGKKYILKLPKDIDADEIGDILSSFDIAYELTPVKEDGE